MIAEDDDTKVPVVAVVGFLPASKEGNLLKHILTGEHGKRVAVVRYADCLGVDGAELERCKCSQCVVDGVDLVETANGCAVACCRRHGDLAAALKKLKARQGCHLFSRLDKIIIDGHVFQGSTSVGSRADSVDVASSEISTAAPWRGFRILSANV